MKPTLSLFHVRTHIRPQIMKVVAAVAEPLAVTSRCWYDRGSSRFWTGTILFVESMRMVEKVRNKMAS